MVRLFLRHIKRRANDHPGNTCLCGNYLDSQPTLATDQTGTLAIVCQGDGTEFCGGASLVQIYATSALASSSLIVTVTPVPSSSSSSTTSSSSSSSSSAAPTIVSSAGGYVNRGAYNDPSPSTSPILVDKVGSFPLSAGACAGYCSGYTYFGLEGGKYRITHLDVKGSTDVSQAIHAIVVMTSPRLPRYLRISLERPILFAAMTSPLSVEVSIDFRSMSFKRRLPAV